jgi:hypothetical protein
MCGISGDGGAGFEDTSEAVRSPLQKPYRSSKVESFRHRFCGISGQKWHKNARKGAKNREFCLPVSKQAVFCKLFIM